MTTPYTGLNAPERHPSVLIYTGAKVRNRLRIFLLLRSIT